jgi:hypothetical protein
VAIYEYVTGLIEIQPDAEATVTGSGWHARLRLPVRRHPNFDGGMEIVLDAGNVAAASKALHLIIAAVDLLEGPLLGKMPRPHSAADPECVNDDVADDHPKPTMYVATTGLWYGCRLAAKASRRKMWQYALAKYHLSQSMYAIHFRDLDPSHAEHEPLSALPQVHLRLAYAIITAYSVLEDLGVEMRASTQKPSRLPNGQLNPVVRQDVEERLVQAHVNITEPMLWTVRGSRRRLDAKRPIPSRGKYRWSRGWVRDCGVDLVDAIAHVSWLRSTVASHGFKPLLTGLSPYDIVNAQHLARRVLLDVLDGPTKPLTRPRSDRLEAPSGRRAR